MTADSSHPYVIEIPRQNWDGRAADMRARLLTWEWRWTHARQARHVLLDFTRVEFMEPWVLAMFASFGAQLHAEGITVDSRLDEANPANLYLRSMGIERVLGSGESTPHWDASRQNTGLHVLRTHQDVSRFLTSVSALGPAPGLETLDALKYGMLELGRNVVQHAQAAAGGVAIAQHFPQMRAVQVAICDAGRGVLDALHTNYPEIHSELEAVKLAVLPHASGAPASGTHGGSDNAGLGLFFCQEICSRTGGSFWLVSGTALLGVNHADESGTARIYRRVNRWPGTLVVMQLPDQDQLEFADVLSTCQHLSLEARSNASAAGLDFVDGGGEVPDDLRRIKIAEFVENVERAAQVREGELKPAIHAGEIVVLDFGGPRFVTQSFVHALLADVFRIPGSLTKLIFANCSKSTQEAVRVVAVYSSAGYRQRQY